jgi:hypothetical protein
VMPGRTSPLTLCVVIRSLTKSFAFWLGMAALCLCGWSSSRADQQVGNAREGEVDRLVRDDVVVGLIFVVRAGCFSSRMCHSHSSCPLSQCMHLSRTQTNPIIFILHVCVSAAPSDAPALNHVSTTAAAKDPRPLLSPTPFPHHIMEAAKKSGCPFAGMAAAATQSMCPFSGAAAKATAEAPAPAVCPLGFGTARGPRLSTLHCPVCKGLLFEAHSITSCKHTFCRSCISQTRDCPSCGRDVDGLQPNSELAGGRETERAMHAGIAPLASCYQAQLLLHAATHHAGLVDTFLDTHSQSPDLVAAQVRTPHAAAASGPPHSKNFPVPLHACMALNKHAHTEGNSSICLQASSCVSVLLHVRLT